MSTPLIRDLTSLYEDERPQLLRLGVLLTQDVSAAEDLVQDAFATLLRRWSSLDDPSRAASYLRVSVVNGGRSFHRRRSVTRRYIARLLDIAPESPDSRILLAEEHRNVAHAVNELPRRQRGVVVLRYWMDMSDDEIASALGIKAVTVRSNASRALKSLSQSLEKLDGNQRG